ncbi:MAG: hypothetical protein HKP30_00665 [Myxococcales bacterium]|nr:hypothetical protein [Myxococcales bacterium]
MRRLRLLLPSLLLASGCFGEFSWEGRAADVTVERLCDEAADPDAAPDTTFIRCRVEGDSFAPAERPARREIVVVSYNVLRGFRTDAQLDYFLNEPGVPVPDVLLLSEVDRGCRRTGFRNVAREWAEALGHHYVYATEFVELPGNRGAAGPYDPPLCEHGNAIVARWPLGNVRAIRHAANRSWYTPPGFPTPDEPRLGGRIAVAADMRVGDRLVRLYSLHLESTLDAAGLRDAQAVEIAEDADGVPWPVIVGGDLNSFGALFTLFVSDTALDGPTRPFFERGYVDAHGTIPATSRATTFDPGALLLDFVLVRDATVRDPGRCPRARCEPLSDHLPIWTTVVLPEGPGIPAAWRADGG